MPISSQTYPNYNFLSQQDLQEPEITKVVKGERAPAFFSEGTGDQPHELFVHMSDIGHPSASWSSVILNEFGRAAGLPLPFLSDYGKRMVTTTSEEYRCKVGREIHWRPEIKSTVTNPGSGIKEIEVEVYGPMRTAQRWWTVGYSFKGETGRQFVVTNTDVSTDGFQTLTLRPHDGVWNLEVDAGGQCTELRDETFMVSLGRNHNMQPQDNEDFVNRYQEYSEETFYPIAKALHLKRSGRNMQNEIMAGNWQTVRSFKSGDGQFMIHAYLFRNEAMDNIRWMVDFNKALFYQDPIKDPELNYLGGSGFVPQIPEEMKFTYTPSQLDPDFLSDKIAMMVENDDLASDTLIAFGGSKAFEAIQRNFGYSGQEYRTTRDVPKSMEEAKQDIFLGQNIKGIYLPWFQKEVIFYPVFAFDRLHNSSRAHPASPRVGIHSGDIFICDTGPISNYNATGDVVDENENKIQFFVQKTENGETFDYQENYKVGVKDLNGNPINGEVNNFTDDIEIRKHVRMGPVLRDKKAMLYGRVV